MNTLQPEVKPNKQANRHKYANKHKFRNRHKSEANQHRESNQTSKTVNPEEQSNPQKEVNPQQEEIKHQSSQHQSNPQKKESAQEQKPVQEKEQKTQENKHQNKKYYRPNGSHKRFQHREHKQQQRQHTQQHLNLANKSVSVVIPLRDEEDSLVELSVALKKVLDPLRCNWEVIFIDDGSTDSSYQKLQEIHRVNSRFKCLKFKRNYGKSAALQEGFKAAKGDYIITMDADLQDDPDEIPALITKLNEGYDLVSGWKKVRHDPFIKRITSKFFNLVTSIMVGLRLHDYNCGLKAYVKDVVKNISVYGEMHRYIPALAHLSGYRVTEIPVTHHERKYGKTKFGLSRFFNGFFDLITVLFTTKFIKRPLHLFGFIGVVSFFSGIGILIYLTILKFVESTPIEGRPLFYVGILMAIVGVQFFSIGLIGEMIAKASIENDNVIIDKTLG